MRRELAGWSELRNECYFSIEVLQSALGITLLAGYGLRYADCFAAAIAEKDTIVVTSETKDFKKIPGLHILPLPDHRE